MVWSVWHIRVYMYVGTSMRWSIETAPRATFPSRYTLYTPFTYYTSCLYIVSPPYWIHDKCIYDMRRPWLVVDGTRHARLPMPVLPSALVCRSARYPLPMLRSIWLISDLKPSFPPTTACTTLFHTIIHFVQNVLTPIYCVQASAQWWTESESSNGCSNVESTPYSYPGRTH